MSTSKNNLSRRNFISTTTSGIIATAVSGAALAQTAENKSNDKKPTRWGFIGTGGIANKMAKTLKNAPAGDLIASSSRTLKKAQDFAKKHGAEKAFDDWKKMINWDEIDAVYVATPTSVKEEISIAAAKAGKHVLAEKPLASLESVKRIIQACKENNVSFMDGTHFSHHPRTINLQQNLSDMIGKRRHVHSIFQFKIGDTSNIRMQPSLEPMGCIGDVGWYNMRAIVDYLDPSIKLKALSTHIRRNPKTNAVIEATGVLAFEDGSSSTWSCGFDSGQGRSNLNIDGTKGAIDIDNFIRQDKDNSASYRLRARGGKGKKSTDEKIRIESSLPGDALMFQDFADQIHDPSLREKWNQKALRTQELLDAVWASALENE